MTTSELFPHNSKAEQALLGSLLIDAGQVDGVRARLEPTDFYDHRHQWIYAALLASDTPDLITVSDELERVGHLEEAGGTAYLAHLLTVPATSQNAGEYAGLVAGDSLRRRLIEAATQLAQAAYADKRDAATIALEMARKLENLTGAAASGDISGAGQAVSEWYDDIRLRLETGKMPGLTTGYSDIDRKTEGMRRQELLILAARPSMGKTSLAAQMSVRQARAGLRVGVATLEVPQAAWIEAAALAEMGMDKFNAGADAIERIIRKCEEYTDLPLQFFERGMVPVAELERAAHQMANAAGGLDVLWVDHLGYIDHGKGDNIPYTIGQTTKRLARLAKDLDCAVACLCQLSRASARTASEPQLTDLRDSGEIEQDARQVWFIHRPGYYADPEPPAQLPQETRLLVRKNHAGPTGRIDLMFVKAQRRFVEVARP